MPSIVFQPQGIRVSAEPETKILAAARRAKVPIRFGCAACQCGTCAVAVDAHAGEVTAMTNDERNLLSKMGLLCDGSIRLSCRARIIAGEISVDLAFQETYSPDSRLDSD